MAHYRRAVWLAKNPKVLSDVLGACIGSFESDPAPKFPYKNDSECVVARRSVDGGVFLHLVTYEAGASAAVIPSVVATEAVDATEADPPPGSEFIQSQLFCYVRGNNVLYTAHNAALREGPVTGLLAEFVGAFSKDDTETQFDLQAVLDIKKLKPILDEGIEEIDLDLGAFSTTIDWLSEGEKLPEHGILGSLGSLLMNSASSEDQKAASDISTRTTLRPGRSWQKKSVRSLLSKMAQNVIASGDDGFKIVTKSGFRITRDQMAVHKPFDVSGNKQILSAVEVRTNLAKLLGEMKEAGILEY
eukprot:Cvel_14147.t1-p1 / transcript=Cvel_14147.t1 / gene=Cvel_14147 / organism=Chromera_velia_CCMP2878 / gene_product=hypothetical protein / transcript_product=hypothetical protein / location=Cvel_scaffold997:2681-3583(-) / protein_length=301 / sequence_SO=supercontig / SO=protein_coding / is_pseudo=false